MGSTPYFSASLRYTPNFSGGMMAISFFSLGGMRQLSQGLYGMIRSLTACFSAEESTIWMRRTVLPDKDVSVFSRTAALAHWFWNRCTSAGSEWRSAA